MEKQEKKDKADLLHGPLLKPIILFAIPLAASGMLQQLFNAADTAVVGRFAGSEAMAAVGSNASVINLIIALFTGLSVGANVVTASLIGQNRRDRIEDAVHTSVAVALISGVFLLFVGQFLASPILSLMGTPEDVMPHAVLYLRLYFIGMPFVMLYNFTSALLRSMGDSRRPLIALIVAGVVNVCLNMVLVIVFHLGVAGVAIATVISNVISSGILTRCLMKEATPFRLDLRKLRIRKDILIWMIKIGLPAGLQGIVFSLSNTVIQSSINSFGSTAVAGSAAALNFEYIAYFAVNAFNQATVTFTSQNFAAGKIDRCRKIYRICLLGGFLSCFAFDLIFVLGESFWLGFFTTDPEVMEWAILRMRNVLLYQALAATYEVTGSTMRGMGYSLSPALLTVFGTCVFRIFWVFALMPTHRSFVFLMRVYPASWIITGALVMGAYFLIRRKAFAAYEG